VTPDQANQIADSLVAQSNAQSATTRDKVARRRVVVDRLMTGVITLVGFGFGWRVGSWLGQEVFAPLFGAGFALLAAVVFPRRQA